MKVIATLIVLFCCAALNAAPAYWHKWRSRLDGQLFCTQTPPGQGWERLDTPYTDARCSRPAAAR